MSSYLYDALNALFAANERHKVQAQAYGFACGYNYGLPVGSTKIDPDEFVTYYMENHADQPMPHVFAEFLKEKYNDKVQSN